MRTKARAALAIALLLSLLTGACTSTVRPELLAWEDTWATARAVVPTIEVLRGEDTSDVCNRALGRLRELREELLPTPDEVLDVTVDEWLGVAEGMLFECPPVNDPDYSTSFATLSRIEAEIALVIDIDESD